ncbi:ubiquinone biosynthesis protein COQ4, putative [Eimeria necatrix]|uniref:Ubiquinone biosynthesis protein COQ4 homolog, mitochondrial n=1 Tax=Eimeria necatrix TaxID=51315 RepID=U6N421_9EIME|nr:ubiquinone biosynthesis protein COQ4, putative [Eimeria necatrix]CDJ69490.1 ubiquinone biosynthesis protein COQ4, putative [Eimeria necatrix]
MGGGYSGAAACGVAAAAAAAAGAAAAAASRLAAAAGLLPFLIKLRVAAEAAKLAVAKPKEDLHVATLSELFAEQQLQRMRSCMLCAGEDEEGREVLQKRPLLDERFLNFEGLRRLPKDTVGHALVHFLDSNLLHAGRRQPVRFVEDEELAYVLTRYRQLHDLMHALFGLGISVEAEVALKLIEFHQTGLPMTFLAAAFGPLAAPHLRVLLSAAAADAAKTGEGPAAAAKDTHALTEAPNSPLQLLLQQQQQQQKGEAAAAANSAAAAKTDAGAAADATAAAAADAAAAAAAAEEPLVLYPRHVLLTELLPWADAAGKAMRRRVYCMFVEEWLDKPLVNPKP